MRLLLVRHGETESNRQGLALGRKDVPLNETGREQARALGRALAGESLAAVYSSPLQRALDTARAVAEPHGLSVGIEEGLVEMNVGETDGLTFAEVRERYPGLLDTWMSAEGPMQPMPGGESLAEVAARAWEAIAGLAERHGDARVVAVAHNFVILCVLSRALGLELPGFRRLTHSVAAVSELDLGPGGAKVLRLNDTCHLGG